MLLALSCFSLLAVASRELTAALSTLEILFWRSLLGGVIVTAILARAGILDRAGLQPQLIGWHALRNVTHFGGQCAPPCLWRKCSRLSSPRPCGRP